MFHVIRNYERVPGLVVQAYADLDVAAAHEALGKQGAMDAAIKLIYDGMRVCGTVLTVRSQPRDNLMLHKSDRHHRPGRGSDSGHRWVGRRAMGTSCR